MFKRSNVQMFAVLAAGAILGYVAASGKFNLIQEANATPTGTTPAVASV